MKIAAIPRRFVRHDWGGTETVVLETSRRMLQLGHQVEILTPSVFTEVRDEHVEGVHVRRYPYLYPFFGLDDSARHRLDKKGGNLFSWGLYRDLLRIPSLDLIHLHTQKRLGAIGRHAAQKRGIPYVVTLHGGILDVPAREADDVVAPIQGKLEWGKALGWWMGSRRVLEDAAAILCVGRNEEEQMKARYPEKRVRFLPNGVDCDRFARGAPTPFRRRLGISDDAPLLLCVGRIDPQKNQGLAISAVASLVSEFPDIHLALIGHVTSESYEDALRVILRTAGLESHVTIIPGLDAHGAELVDAYAAADVFVLPSVHEPFGIVILEAWAASLPVVAANVGGIPSFVEHQRDALLFPSDDMLALATSVRELLTSPETARRLAASGRQKARERYDWTTVSQSLLSLYEEVAHAHPVRQ